MESPNRQVLSLGARLLDPWTCPKTLARTLKSAYVFFDVRRIPGRYRCELGLRSLVQGGALRVGTNIGGEEGQVGCTTVFTGARRVWGFAGGTQHQFLRAVADPNLNSRRSRNINGIREKLLVPERILVV